MSDWWYVEKQNRTGPVSELDLRRLLQAGKINLSTLAWQEGMETWQPLGEIERLSSLLESFPPPLPQKNEVNPGSLPLATRWPRYFARTFDMWWETLLVAYTTGLVLGHYSAWFVVLINKPGTSFWFGILCLPVAMLLDAMLFAIAGNTPGKALLGIKVTQLDGSALSFGQYITRNFLCWASGYAFGLPLANLVTMYKQSTRVQKGLPATYDEGLAFRVHVRPFRTWRATLFIVLFLGLLGLMGYLNNMENASQRDSIRKRQESYFWENPTTQVRASVEANWKHSTQTNEEGQRVYVFNELTNHAVIILAEEMSSGNFTLDDYVRAFRNASKANMSFSDEGRYFIKYESPAWQCLGRMTNVNNANRLSVQIVQRGASFWRTVSIQTMPYDYSDAMAKELQSALWSTIR
jgi:uncharacterized RDD family membrane protein YckC